ncbi:hypothetical protein BH11BAC2_BH11BAC2_26470 [soil metagenome]
MKRLILSVFALLIAYVSGAQSNLILFTENGEKFTAILNGIRQNEKPETNVKITSLNAEFYKLKVIFDNQAFGEKNMNVAVEPGSETTYTIKKNTKGEFVLRLISSVPIAQAPPAPASQTVVVYGQTPAPEPAPAATVTHQTTTTTTTTGGNGNPDNVNFNMGINVGETGGSINMNMSGMDGSTSAQTTTIHQQSTTTTTTTTTTDPYSAPAPAPVPPPNYLPGYTGPIACPIPMNPEDFSSLKQSIKAKSFEDTKMTIAKQVVGNQCLLVSQVKDLLGLFSFEDSKLDLAKFSYNHTYDIGNYFKINDVFSFESSTEELNEYIQSRK